MKSEHLAVLIAVAFSGCTGASTRKSDGTYEIETKLDEYSGTKVQRVEIPLQQGGFVHFQQQLWLSTGTSEELDAARKRLEAAGVPITAETETVSATFYRTGETWAYLKCHRVDFLADGERFNPSSDHDGSVGSGLVYEYVHFSLSPAYLRKLASAQSAKMRVCNYEHEFSAGVKTTFANFVDQMDPAITDRRETCLQIQDNYDDCMASGGVDPTKHE